MSDHRRRWLSRLDRRYFRAFLPPVLGVLLIVASIDGYISFHAARKQTLSDGEQLLALYATSLQKPLWDVDSEAIEAILEVFASSPIIHGVRLVADGGRNVFQSGAAIDAEARDVLSQELFYTDRHGRCYDLGRLAVQLDKPNFWSSARYGMATYLPVILAALLSAVITGLFVNRRLVTRPLRLFRKLIEKGRHGAGCQLGLADLPRDELGEVMLAYSEAERQRQAVVDELQESRKDAQQIIEAMAAPVFIHPWAPESDPLPNFSLVNRSAMEMLGLSREELLASAPGRIDDISESQSELLVKKIVREGKATFETNLRHKDGRLIPVEISTSIVTLSGQPTAVAVARSLEEYRRREVALQEAVAKAEEANRAKSEFIANISHEIRTPLNAIIGFSEILASSLQEPDLSKKAGIIAQSGQNLLALINDILDLAKIEAGHLKIFRRPVAVSHFFEEICAMFSTQAEAKNLVLSLHLSPTLPVYLLLDETRLRQILVNLIGNALKFTEVGSVTLDVEVQEITSGGNLNLDISVTDTGPGIPDEFKERIFQNFEQLPGATGIQEGTGLGLAIASHLAILIGGTIRVTDHPMGVGSVFTLHLENVPVVSPDESSAPAHSTRGSSSLPRLVFKSHPLVLIVDDIPNNRFLLKDYLEKGGFSTKMAANGREALALVKAHRPVLVLTDIRMPEMNGREFLQALRALPDPNLQKIPVIATTALAMPEQVSADKEMFDGHVTKPVSAKMLFTEMARFLPHHVIAETATPVDEESEVFTDELIAVMDGAWLSRIQRVKARLHIQDARDLAADLQEVGHSTDCGKLQKLARCLERDAIHFDIASMEKTLLQLEQFVQAVLANGG